jgi:hypothetical protein
MEHLPPPMLLLSLGLSHASHPPLYFAAAVRKICVHLPRDTTSGEMSGMLTSGGADPT